MNLKPTLGSSHFGLEISSELRKQSVGRMASVSDSKRQAVEKLLPAGRLEKEGHFVHSLDFVENQPLPLPPAFKHGVPLVQRLILNWL